MAVFLIVMDDDKSCFTVEGPMSLQQEKCWTDALAAAQAKGRDVRGELKQSRLSIEEMANIYGWANPDLARLPSGSIVHPSHS